MIFKRIFVTAAVFFIAITAVTAQNRQLTVEESYLQQSLELMIIREHTRAEGREMKLIALEYISDAISRGNTGPEIKEALEYMGIEGTINQTRENGRLVNNYPDIRVRAATYLGDLGTPEAKDSLIKMALADNEPMVLTEVIKSLGRIGINDNDEVSSTISFIVRHYDVLNPDNLLALAALEAFEKLAASNGRIDQNSVQTVLRIANGHYLTAVREKARLVLADLTRASLRGQ